MPIPLKYAACHTFRLGGTWSLNCQNFPAGRGGQVSKLRQSIIVPKGCKVVAADLSQVECRVCAWLCGQQDLLDIFQNNLDPMKPKIDPYALLASDVFGFPVDRKVHTIEGFVGKEGVLSLQFRAGGPRFYASVIRSGRKFKIDMVKLGEVWTEDKAQQTVDVYRRKNSKIRSAWYELDRLLKTVWADADGYYGPTPWGGPNGNAVVIGPGYVALPSELKMHYDVQNRDPNFDLSYRYGREMHKIHGGVLLENIVQATARVHAMNAALRLQDYGLWFGGQEHDSLYFCVPENDAENAAKLILQELRRRPSWAPSLPLDAEVKIGDNWAEVK